MTHVAAPLYRFFLADAQAAARSGDTERMSECLGLAIDFSPETQRERVLLAAAELVPPVWGAAGSGVHDGSSSNTPQPLVVEIAPGGLAPRQAGRIAWEDQGTRPASVGAYSVPAQPEPLQSRGPRSAFRGLRRIVALASVLAALTAAVREEWFPAGAAGALRRNPVDRAARALDAGDAEGALRLLDSLGPQAPAHAWLLRASAHEALADTAAAVAALARAAVQDTDGGRLALEAGDRIAALGAASQAADAYLYAATPRRTEEELERIARMQERAGHLDRARRVRRARQR